MSSESFAHQVIRASAGSGKTHQLTNRYLGLLAAGIEPESMLATTFTRKAAAEILERVLLRLAKAAGDPGLTGTLSREIGRPLAPPADATKLLRKLLSNLHRVRISTLDSFYIALAGSFSLELALPAGWSICEEGDDAELRREALEALLDHQPDDIVNLFPLLSKGEFKRSVQRELHDIIGRHHDIFLGSKRAAWESLRVPAGVPAAQTKAALEQLQSVNPSSFPDKRMIDARNKDIGRFEQQDWVGFIGNGLAGKVASGDPTYYKKQIPTTAQAHYAKLVQFACSELLRRLADQTRATFDLLERFDHELRLLKQVGGQLRFGEVTQALVEGLERKSLGADGLAFRLDGGVEHLLLDEFQDTALPQWQVLQPIAQRITKTLAAGRQSTADSRSFFCVGDVKQAIYGWRGGMAAILDTLRIHLGQLKESPLLESRRSAQPVIDAVNQFFGGLNQLDLGEKAQDGLAIWHERFDSHTTFHKTLPGYVCLHAGPGRQDDQTLDDYRAKHYAYVAERVAALVRLAPGRSVGVLCRTNPAVARMIYELRQKQVEASEEGGNALTDSPAVELILSLFTLADHPGHSVAWFHLQNSPLHAELPSNAEKFSGQLRRSLLADGCGKFTQGWAAKIAPVCDRRDLSRLQQVVEMAYTYQARGTLRADDFVNYVRQKKVLDPSGAAVRVMTIHGAKGLQFDAVVLPELDCQLSGRAPTFVVGRDPKTLEVNFVSRYADEAVQGLLEPAQRAAFEHNRQQRIEESLSLLYVAVTRAVHALYMVIPGPYKGKYAGKTAWCNLLVQSLAPNVTPIEKANIWQHGDGKWFQKVKTETPASFQESSPPQPISFLEAKPERRRGMEHIAPSSREGEAKVPLDRLFNPSEGTGTAAGTLYHAWFEAIEWLDNGPPTDQTLHAVAQKLRSKMPAETWRDLDKLVATFHGWLKHAPIAAPLKQAAYANPHAAGFPAALASIWRSTICPLKPERERRFLVRDKDSFWNGSLDRVVWLAENNRVVAADVLDYKTDALVPGDEAALQARVAHYRPQIEAYRRIVAKIANIEETSVAARLLFTCVGKVVDI